MQRRRLPVGSETRGAAEQVICKAQRVRTDDKPRAVVILSEAKNLKKMFR